MYVLKFKDSRYQINKEWRTADDVARTREDGYIVCRSRNLAQKLLWSGFEMVIDPKGDFPDGRKGYNKGRAATYLGVPVPVVNRWVESGDLKAFELSGSLWFDEYSLEGFNRNRE